MHDPPPPYTPTDPAAMILPSVQSNRPANLESSPTIQEVSSENSAALINGASLLTPVPIAVSLPGAPLPPSSTTVPLVPGPPLLGQGNFFQNVKKNRF